MNYIVLSALLKIKLHPKGCFWSDVELFSEQFLKEPFFNDLKKLFCNWKVPHSLKERFSAIKYLLCSG